MCDVAIDTCVFMHLLNPQNNENKHINGLLSHFVHFNFFLLVDSTKKIPKEYESRIVPILRKSFDTGTEIYLLRYWMNSARHTVVQLDTRDTLMRRIETVICERGEHADRAFVYVACKRDSDLVTNDIQHILRRRQSILRQTSRYRGNNTRILSSVDAFKGISA